jgi:pyruvate dehydrogenase E2 component (dihydrolipoamide acetyltransferase)
VCDRSGVAVEVRMPELSSDMTEADLVSWLVAPGDSVQKGDLICELETEKSTVEFESPLAGTLIEIVIPEGTNGVEIGTVIAIFDAAAETETGASTHAPAQAPQAQRQTQAQEPAQADGSADAVPATDAGARASAAPSREVSSNDISATALARRIAEQSGVPLSDVAGSGPGGRIVKADVDAAAEAGVGPAEVSTEGPAASDSSESPRDPGSDREAAAVSFESDTPYTAIKLSRMRRTIAARLTASKQTIPHFYLRVECEIDRLIELRAQLNADDRRISINDFVVRAAALALVEVPDANVTYTEDALIRYDRVDVAVAVATEGGLVTPLVRDADRKELEALSETLRDLATRAREGKLTPKEYQGGSFTVSNLGMYGVESVYPIVNPPQSCILGVGAGEQKPVVRDGGLEAGTVMSCTLSADHRAVDGAVGARLLTAIKRRLEDPLEMLL